MNLLRTLAAILCLASPLAGKGYNAFYADFGLGFDYFRSLPEGGWEGNSGGFASLNFAKEMPYFCSRDYGVQLGGSYGIYDWNGRGSAPSGRQKAAQQQGIVSVGLFKQAFCGSGLNFGLVYDWMWNKNFGVFALKTNVDQLRFQTGYMCGARNEFGVWGTVDLHWSGQSSQQIPVTYRAISQVNAFWRHIFENCAEAAIWGGIPYKRSLMFSTGRAGKFIVGGSFMAPLSERLEIEGHASYMHPHSGENKHRNYAANIAIELKWLFCGRGKGIRPYMPIGNNSNFIVDTDVNF